MKSFSIAVQKPCQEKWETFKPTTSGGLCAACKKEVTDFTSWTDDQIIQYFSQPITFGCGRFKDSQLRFYSKASAKKTGWLYPVALSLVLLMFNQRTLGQTIKKSSLPEFVEKDYTKQVFKNQHSSSDSVMMIRGTVKSGYDSSVLANVKISGRGGFVIARTDSSGKFEFSVSREFINDTIEFSAPRFIAERRTLKSDDMNIILSPIEFQLVSVTMGGLIAYRRWSPRGIWWRIKNVFRRN